MAYEQAARPTYTPEQLERYLDYIAFPKDARITQDAVNTEEAGLPFLTQLIKHQLVRIPFENLDMHYSTHHTITLDVQHLFHKIVERACGKGGYCMELNLFFATILRSLGYQVMPVGARVSSAADLGDDTNVDYARYSGLSHTVNIITIAGKQYFVDVGFGPRGPTIPVPCVDGMTGRTTGDSTGGNLYRLARENIKDTTHSDPSQKMWVYSCRFNENMRYMPLYCFTDIEFLPQDFAIMSFYVSQSKASWFGHKIICVKFIQGSTRAKDGDGDGDGDGNGNSDGNENEFLIGEVTLWGDTVKKREFGRSTKLCDIKTERDRIDALEKYFGITLTEPEINGIQGMVSAIV